MLHGFSILNIISLITKKIFRIWTGGAGIASMDVRKAFQDYITQKDMTELKALLSWLRHTRHKRDAYSSPQLHNIDTMLHNVSFYTV